MIWGVQLDNYREKVGIYLEVYLGTIGACLGDGIWISGVFGCGEGVAK